MYDKYLLKSKYQLLINRSEKAGIKNLKNPEAFIYDLFENLKYYNPTKKRRVLIFLDYMIGDIESNKKLITLVIAH